MKNLQKTALLLVLFAGLVFTAQAQKISLPSPDFKKDMSDAFSPGSDLNISEDKKAELKKSNDSFLDSVVDIAGGSSSDIEKKKSLLDLGKKQSGVFSDILGEDAAKHYKKSVKKKIRPFKTKYKLATLIL